MLGRAEELIGGRLLARNVALNLAGWGLPAVAALVAFPVLLHAMGTERFGLLALVWSLIGYLSLFDLGIGRALTQVLSAGVGTDADADAAPLTWTALWLLLPMGLAFAGAIALGAAPSARSVLDVPPAMRGETAQAVLLLAAAVPFLVLTSGLRAVLEAGQRFRAINALRVPLGLLTFLGPVAVQSVSHTLPAAVAVVTGARVLIFALHAVVVARAFPALRRPRRPGRAYVRRLWRAAGWMTVSSVVSPLLVAADRLVIGALLPVAALTYYATASEVASKLWLYTAALQPVLFPALAATLVRDRERAAVLFDRGVRFTVLGLALPALVLTLVPHEGLSLWLGAAVADRSAVLLQAMAAAVVVNSVGQMAYAVLQGAGRAELSGALHLVELPLYLALLWALLARFGVVGVALAWVLRQSADALGMLWMVRRILPEAAAAVHRAGRLIGLTFVVALVAAVPLALAWRLLLGSALAAAIVVLGWRRLVTAEERAVVRPLLATLVRRRRGVADAGAS